MKLCKILCLCYCLLGLAGCFCICPRLVSLIQLGSAGQVPVGSPSKGLKLDGDPDLHSLSQFPVGKFELVPMTSRKKKKKGLAGKSICKSIVPRSHDGKREQTPTTCPLISMHMSWHMDVCVCSDANTATS